MLLLGLFNFHLDVNAGVKYWFSEEWFCGLRLQYCFYSFSILSLLGSYSDIDLSEYPSGIVDLDLDRGTALASYILPKSTAEAVISVGEDNKYGHPKSEILKRLSKMNCEVYRTDLHGNIVFESDGKNISVIVEK